MIAKRKHQDPDPEYTPEESYNKLRELFFTARENGHTTIELPARLVGFISGWLMQLCNLKSELAEYKNEVEGLHDLLQNAQDIYNAEGRTEEKDKEIRKLFGIVKQKLDAKGRPFDNVQLFVEYSRTVMGWSYSKIKDKNLNDKKEQIIEYMRAKYDLPSRGALITRLKKGKKQLIENGEDNYQYKGVFPKDWPEY